MRLLGSWILALQPLLALNRALESDAQARANHLAQKMPVAAEDTLYAADGPLDFYGAGSPLLLAWSRMFGASLTHGVPDYCLNRRH